MEDLQSEWRRRYRRDTETRGHRVPVGLPCPGVDRRRRQGWHTAHNLQAGARRHGHRRRLQPHDERQAPRRFRHAARARLRERIPRGCPGILRQRADPAHTGRGTHDPGPHLPRLQLRRELPARHQVGRPDQLRRAHPRADAPGLLPPAHRQGRPRPRRGAAGRLAGRVHRRDRLHARPRQPLRARPGRGRRRREGAPGRREPRHPRRPGLPLRRGVERAPSSSPSSSRPR